MTVSTEKSTGVAREHLIPVFKDFYAQKVADNTTPSISQGSLRARLEGAATVASNINAPTYTRIQARINDVTQLLFSVAASGKNHFSSAFREAFHHSATSGISTLKELAALATQENLTENQKILQQAIDELEQINAEINPPALTA